MAETSNNFMLTRMETFNFNEPIRVVALFEEEEEANDVQVLNKKNTGNTTEISPGHRIDFKRGYTANVGLGNTKTVLNTEHQVPTVGNLNTTQTNSITNKPTQNNQHQIRYKVQNTDIKQPRCIVENTSTDFHTRLLHLLDAVSYNLIEISKCFFVNFYSNPNMNKDLLQQANLDYRYFQVHYFKLSYNIVVDILLPQENNKVFIEKYINRTITLAANRSWHIDRSYLRGLINTLFLWTKKERLLLKTRNQNKIQSCNICVPSDSSINNRNLNAQNGKPTNENTICLFSTGQQDQQICITVDEEILRRINRNNSNNCNNLKPSPNQGPTSSGHAPPGNHVNKDPDNSEMFRRSDVYEFDKRNQSEPGTNSIRNMLLSKTSSDIDPHNNEDIIAVETQFLNSNNELTRLNLSPDSGFVTPVSDTNLQKQSFSNVSEPTLSTIYDEGLVRCKVCYTLTQKRCLGCFQVYYCSLKCQKKDWVLHEFVCRNIQT